MRFVIVGDFYTGLGESATDANGRQSTTDYDSNTLRPTTATLPTGAHTDYAYDDVAMTVTATTYLEAHPTHTTIADQNVKYLNGRGQVRQEKALGAGGVWDFVDTTYDNLGQVVEQTQPYRTGTPPATTVTYDALGRPKTVTTPDGSVTETFYNEATRPSVASSTPGETTLVRDAWGRERWGRSDATGRLVEVVEPDPTGNGSVASNGFVTTYNYDTLGKLTEINQGAQTRRFKYDSLGRLIAQKLAETSATINDSGAYVGLGGSGARWGDYFRFDNNRSNLVQRIDARGVKTNYWYFNSSGHTDPGDGTEPDPLNRLQSVSWDTTIANQGLQPTDPNYVLNADTVSYQYRQKTIGSELKDITQLDNVATQGVSTESYGYDAEGRVSSKTLTLTSRPSYPFVTGYIYDLLDRVQDVRYPAQYGNGNARKVVHHDYDIASRLTSLTYDNQSFASNIVYNAASQTTSLNVGSGANQIAESYSYNAQTGLLDSQTVMRGATPLLDLSYDYTNANGKRTGQLTKILNNLDHAKDRGYSYDALGRLAQATGGPSVSPTWSQTYTYDRYGNRTSVSASGYSASNKFAIRSPQSEIAKVSEPRQVGVATRSTGKISDPTVTLPTDLLARNSAVELPTTSVKDRQPLSDSPPTLRASAEPPQSGPPTFTDDPLNDPNNPESFKIKALHVTQLRTWINALRNHRGLENYIWVKPTASGGAINSSVLISWEPIDEMRTALDQALGPPSGGYSAGLAQGQPVLAIHIQELRDRVKNNWNSSVQIPRDGHASLSYDTTSNRITTSGFDYDKGGNQVRALIPGGSGSQQYRYDAANRLAQVRTDDNNTIIASYTYGDDNQRLIGEEAGTRTYYVAEGLSVIAEYVENGGSVNPGWFKSDVYLGNRLLATLTPNGSGGETTQFHHPDRLGTRIVTDPQNGSFFEQQTLPFGTALNESPPPGATFDSTNRRFTSYDRSDTTKLDYAVNRHYDAQQGRFTQVDPAGASGVDFSSPQTLNLYAYCSDDPINRIDRDGLGILSFIAKIFRAVTKVLKWVVIVLAVVFVVALTLAVFNLPGAQFLADVFWKGIGLLLKFMAKAGIMQLAEGGGLTVGLTGQIVGAAMTVGAVANHLQSTQESKQSEGRRYCRWSVRITFYDSPKNKTAIGGKKPVEGRTAAADPEEFGLKYPRGAKQTADDVKAIQDSQKAMKDANITVGIIPDTSMSKQVLKRLEGGLKNMTPPYKGLVIEDVGGGVRGAHIDIYVESGAKQLGTLNADVYLSIPQTMDCPKGSTETPR